MDFTMADFRDVVASFSEMCGEFVSKHRGAPGVPKGLIIFTQGVKIACAGDMKYLKQDKLTAIDTSQFRSGLLSSIAVGDVSLRGETPAITKIIGMPVRVFRYPTGREWLNTDDLYRNQMATFAFIEPDPEKEDFGWVPRPRWDKLVGSVLLVCEDGQPLTLIEAEALAHYCRYVVEPYIEGTMGEGAGNFDRTKQSTIKYITKAYFDEFLQQFKEEYPNYSKRPTGREWTAERDTKRFEREEERLSSGAWEYGYETDDSDPCW